MFECMCTGAYTCAYVCVYSCTNVCVYSCTNGCVYSCTNVCVMCMRVWVSAFVQSVLYVFVCVSVTEQHTPERVCLRACLPVQIRRRVSHNAMFCGTLNLWASHTLPVSDFNLSGKNRWRNLNFPCSFSHHERMRSAQPHFIGVAEYWESLMCEQRSVFLTRVRDKGWKGMSYLQGDLILAIISSLLSVECYTLVEMLPLVS